MQKSSADSGSDQMLILIDRLSVKISRKCLKCPVPGDTYEQSGTLCYRGLNLDIGWLLLLAPVPRQGGGPGRLRTLHSILIITMHHQQIAPTKRCPFSGTLSEMKNTLFPQIVCWNTANRVWPLGCLLKKSFSAAASWLHVQHRCLRSFITQLLSSLHSAALITAMLCTFVWLTA